MSALINNRRRRERCWYRQIRRSLYNCSEFIRIGSYNEYRRLHRGRHNLEAAATRYSLLKKKAFLDLDLDAQIFIYFQRRYPHIDIDQRTIHLLRRGTVFE